MKDVKKLLDTAQILLELQGNLRDAEAKGTLRGGSVGWMSEDGKDCAGTCPRRAWARMQGYQVEDNSTKQHMFQAGHLSEDGLLELLHLVWTGIIKCEEEIPISWQVSNGTFVTGRPDVVLCTPEGIPVEGLEAKLVSSMWTALDIIHTPKMIHVMQAAHYAKKLQLPWVVVYVNRTNWSLLSDFALRKAPKEGEPGSEFVEYVERNKPIVDKKTGEKKKIKFREGKAMKPFHQTYPLRWNSQDEVEILIGGEFLPSFISWDGIERFYEFVSRMSDGGQLGPVPTEVDIFGDMKGFSTCDYCPLKAVCASPDLTLDKFQKACESTHDLVHKGQLETLQRLQGIK